MSKNLIGNKSQPEVISKERLMDAISKCGGERQYILQELDISGEELNALFRLHRGCEEAYYKIFDTTLIELAIIGLIQRVNKGNTSDLKCLKRSLSNDEYTKLIEYAVKKGMRLNIQSEKH